MNVYIVFVLSFYCVFALELLKKSSAKGFYNERIGFGQDYDIDGIGNEMNSTVHMSVNHFYCLIEDVKDETLILYGTKSWTFPLQDVNLTLSYPSSNSKKYSSSIQLAESESSSKEDGYLVTGFKVVLYIDGMETKGYITSGGVMKQSISLSFINQNVSTLSYQFWLYGIPIDTADGHIENFNSLHTQILCP